MSVVADVRNVLEDLVVPDLKALQQHVGALEKRMNERFQELEQRMNERFQGLEHRMDERFGQLEQRTNDRFEGIDQRFDRAERDAERRHAELISYLSLEARVRKIELEQGHETRS